MNEIDDAIGKVEILFRTLTGREAPPLEVPYAPIPAERDPALHVQEQMDRLMWMLGVNGREPSVAATVWTPAMSVWEAPNETLFCIDLPGVARDQLEVGLQGSLVVVAGRRLPPPETSPEAARLRPRATEQGFGIFRRVIPLPPTALRDQMTAWLKDGVLWLRVPSDAAVQARSISVS
jgi:HSP20 family protein